MSIKNVALAAWIQGFDFEGDNKVTSAFQFSSWKLPIFWSYTILFKISCWWGQLSSYISMQEKKSREYIWHKVQQRNYGCDNMSIGNNCWKPWHNRIPLLLHLVIIVLFIHDIPSKSRRKVLQMNLKYMGTNILCIYTHIERVCICVYVHTHTHTHWSTLKCAAPSKRSIHLPILITSQTCCSINRQT